MGFTLLASAAGAEPESVVVRSPMQRLEPARLEATRRAVEQIRRQRQLVAPVPGLNDYRCIFHAHAEDAAHTGGTRPEMLSDARRAGVHAIFLSDHFRPPRDFMDSWRGFHEGVLFVPGSEVRGFLAHPTNSILPQMQAPTEAFVNAVGAGDGLIFLSHIEERPDHSMQGLHGLEIYNRHYDAKRDLAGLLALAMKLTDPLELAAFSELVRQYPDEILAAQVRRPEAYLEKWDAETRQGRRLTGIAANDCHHNQVLIVKKVDDDTVAVGTIVDKDEDLRKVTSALRPGVRRLTAGHAPGEILGRLDLDPYFRSFRNVATHVLAPELTEAALRQALHDGHAFVAHDWMCDATGFRFALHAQDPAHSTPAILGDAVTFQKGLRLFVRAPAPCRIRILREGKTLTSADGRELDTDLPAAGVYRAEAAFFIDGEWREWIYANPIYVRRP